MKNISRIESFLPETRFKGENIENLLPEKRTLNEAMKDASDLDGKAISEVSISDWLWAFQLEKKMFPKNSVFTKLLNNTDEELSIFTAQIVNTFAIEAWKAIKTKKIFSVSISEKDKKSIKSKLRGFWGTKKTLERYKEEKETLKEFLIEFEKFLESGELGASIQENADSIILNKGETSADVLSGVMTKIFTNLKDFFSQATWQKGVAWLINNIAKNDQYVTWLDTTIYEPNTISSGVSPDISSAFNSFIVDANLNANLPDMETAIPSIKKVSKLVIEKSKSMPAQGKETWMGALYNTYLFGLYQRMLIIGCCAWVYDQIGDTDIMSYPGVIEKPYDYEETSAQADTSGLREEEYMGIKVFKIAYTSPEFLRILKALRQEGQIGDSRYQEYINRIDSRRDSRDIIRSVRRELIGWGNTHGFSRTTNPEVKGLYTDGSTRLIIPISMFKKLV